MSHDLITEATKLAERLGAASVRTRMDSLAGMGHALMSHLEAEGTRAIIVAPTRDTARKVFDEITAGWPLRFEKIQREGMQAYVRDGGVLLGDTLERPSHYMGRQFSYAVVVLTPRLADLLDSLENLNLGLRLGDKPTQVQYVQR